MQWGASEVLKPVDPGILGSNPSPTTHQVGDLEGMTWFPLPQCHRPQSGDDRRWSRGAKVRATQSHALILLLEKMRPGREGTRRWGTGLPVQRSCLIVEAVCQEIKGLAVGGEPASGKGGSGFPISRRTGEATRASPGSRCFSSRASLSC